MRRPLRLSALLFSGLLVLAAPLVAEDVKIAPDESIFAVVTHKGGFASGMAHNHLIAAADYRASLSFDPAAPLDTRFEITLASEQLAVDPWDVEQARYPRLEELGILDEPFTEVADKDRDRIRKAMLGKGQLDANGHPEIKARITGVREQAATHGGVEFPFAADLELEVRGKKVKKPVAARYQLDGAGLTVEAVGAFLFTDFGIKPYSAFLGAVKNEDEFHVYVSLKGSPAPTRPAAR